MLSEGRLGVSGTGPRIEAFSFFNMAKICERLAILELYEEWEAPTRTLILQQFEKESENWQKESALRKGNNDDLFRDVKLPGSLDVCSNGRDQEGNSLAENEEFSKVKKHDSKRKSKKGALLKRLRRRKSKEKVKRQERKTRVKSIMSPGCSSSRHRRKGRKKDSSFTKDDNFKVPNISKTEQTICLSACPTQQTTNSPLIDQPPTLDLNNDNVSKLSSPLNCNRGLKFSNKNDMPFILRVNEEQKIRNSSKIHSVIVPVIPKGPSAPQLAMQIVQSLAWDTVRRIRRRGYAEGFDIVLVKPKGMPEAPSLLAMQNSKGDLTISCDSLSNQTALSQILGLLHKTVSSGYAAR